MGDNRYITEVDTSEGRRYRVRIPQGDGRASVGTYQTLDEARQERDRALGALRGAESDDSEDWPTLSRGGSDFPRPGFLRGAIDAAQEDTRRVIGEAIRDKVSARYAADIPIAAINVPAAINALPDPPLALNLGRWLYASDFHAPLHSVEMTRRLVQVGRHRKVEHLVIGGDFLDLAHISRHGRANRLVSGREAARVAGELLAFLLDEFNVYILPGNHDDRVAKKLDDDWSFRAVLYGMLDGRTFRNRLTVTDDYAYIYVQGAKRKWVVGHPDFYSSIPAKGIAEVAQLQQCSVIGAHNHLQGVMFSADGRHIAIDPGCMTDTELTPYVMKQRGISRYRSWRQGFVLVDNDIPLVCADGLIDWGKVGAN